MSLTTSVGPSGDYRRAHGGDTYGWDWSATTHTAPERPGARRIVATGLAGVDVMTPTVLVDELLASLGTDRVTLGKGLQGWPRSLEAFDAGGYKLGAVYFGGGREDVHVVSTSSQADATRRAVVGIGEAKTARVDTRVDTLLSFEELRGICMGLGGRGTKFRYIEGGRLDGAGGVESTGRTLYVGSPSSAVQVRVYEKWLESPGLYVEGTNRVEVQLRPPSRAKGDVSRWGPVETFCASRLTRRLAEALELDVAAPGSLQKSKGTPDLERTLEAMGEQYGNAARKWLALSGGDVGTVLDRLLAQGAVDEGDPAAS